MELVVDKSKYGTLIIRAKTVLNDAPNQNTAKCYDSRHYGETCNGCLGIIKNSFSADYKGSVFTFIDNEFYALKSNGPGSNGRYDLTNPQDTGRPEVCNSEWTGGGLRIEPPQHR